MSNRGNAPFQVLVASGDAALLAAGGLKSALAVGQLGIFSRETNVAIDGTVLTDADEIVIGVGLDTTGDTVQDSIGTSAGQFIDASAIDSYTLRCYTPSQPIIFELTDFTAECETEYGVKFEFESQESFRLNGYNGAYKTFLVTTSCCGAGCACPDGDCNELAQLIVGAVNNDEEGLLVAELISPTGAVDGAGGEPYSTPGTVITDITVFTTANPTLCANVRFTAQAEAVKAYCGIDPKYFNPRGLVVKANLIEGFDCNGTLTKTQDIVFEEGSGKEVGQLEYVAGGFNGRPGPYRQSGLHGLPSPDIVRYAVATTPYVLVTLVSTQKSASGFQNFSNEAETIIAVPCADTTTRTSLITFLDRIVALSNKSALLDDNVACPSCTTVNQTADQDDKAEDGIA